MTSQQRTPKEFARPKEIATGDRSPFGQSERNTLLRIGTPRLLVSVRSVEEAQAAVAGGTDIIDVKDPASGSLGMATIDTISAIAQWILCRDDSVPMSVALGEMREWREGSTVPSLPTEVSFAKMGLSNCASRSNWCRDWQQIRSRFDAQRSTPLNWVAVAYADAHEAQSPDIMEILDAAAKTACTGLLIDTWTKDGRSVLEELDTKTLEKIAHACRDAKLFFALAGRLYQSQLVQLKHVDADIVAIRSAACLQSDRTSGIVESLVTAFQSEMQRVWPSHQPVAS